MGTEEAWRFALALTILVIGAALPSKAAPVSESTELESYDDEGAGCYYNFQHYGEGDRIMTNEPCLNCTCHNRMLMCYLRVCPFTKAIGQDCTVEKRADQCCPIITCPDVRVDLVDSTTLSSLDSTEVGHHDRFGCSINNRFYTEGAQVPSNPEKPCELCYCIRNMTNCVMQECTLHVEGCTPVYQRGVCCPVRYACEHPEDDGPLMIEDATTTTVRPTPGFLLTTTSQPGFTAECTHNEVVYADGALIPTEQACEHCYCMKGDIVCAVQECGTPMENEGKNCSAVAPKLGQCCPDTYICEGDEPSISTIPESDSSEITDDRLHTVSPSIKKDDKEPEAEEQDKVSPQELEKDDSHTEKPKHDELITPVPEKEDKSTYTPDYDKKAQEPEKDDFHTEKSDLDKTTQQEQEKDELHTQKPYRDEIITQEPEKDVSHTEKPDQDELLTREPEKDDILTDRPGHYELTTQTPEDDKIVSQDLEKDMLHPEKPGQDEVTPQELEKDQKPDHDEKKPEEDEEHTEKVEDKLLTKEPQIDELHTEKPDRDEMISQSTEKDDFHTVKPVHGELQPQELEKDELLTEKPVSDKIIPKKPETDDLHAEKPDSDEIITQEPEKNDLHTDKPEHDEHIKKPGKDDLHTESPEGDEKVPQDLEKETSHPKKPEHDEIVPQESEKDDLHTEKPGQDEHITQEPDKYDMHTETSEHDKPVKDVLHTVKPGQDEVITQEPVKDDMPTEQPEHDKPEKDDLHTVKPSQDELITQEPDKDDMPTEQPEHDKPEKDDLHTVKPSQDELITQEPVKDDMPTEQPEHDKPEKDDLHTVKPSQDELITQEPVKDDMQTETPETDKIPQDLEKDRLHPEKPGHDEVTPQEPEKDQKLGDDKKTSQELDKDEDHTEKIDDKLSTQEPQIDDLHAEKETEYPKEVTKHKFPVEDKPELDDKNKISTPEAPEYSQSTTQSSEDNEQKTSQISDTTSVKDDTTVRYHGDSLDTTEHSSAEVTSHPPLDKVPQHRDDVSGELEHITEGIFTPPKLAEGDQYPSEEPQEHGEFTTSSNAGDEIVTSGPSQTEQDVVIMDHVTDAHITLMEEEKPLPTRFESNEDDQKTEKSTVLTDSGTSTPRASIDDTTESTKTSDDDIQHPEDDGKVPVSVTKHVDESSTSSLGHIHTPSEDHEESSGDSFLDIHQPTTKYGEEDGSGEIISKPKPTEKPIKRVEDVSESQENESDKKVSDISPDISHEFDSTEEKSAEDSSQKHDESTTKLTEKDTRTTSPPVKSSSSESETESQEESDKLHEIFSDDDKKPTETPTETTNVDLSIFDDSTKRDEAHIHDRVSDDESSEKLDVPSKHTEKESQSTTVVSLKAETVTPSVEKEVTTKSSDSADVTPKEFEKTTVYPHEAVSEHDSEISHTEAADVQIAEDEISSDKPGHPETESPETVHSQTDEPVIHSKPDVVDVDSEKTEQKTEIPVIVQQQTDTPVHDTKPSVVDNEIYSQKPEHITELPVNVYSQTEQSTAHTTQAAIQIILDDSTTSRIEDQNVEVTTLRDEATTIDHINEADNEIEGDVHLPDDYQPPRIPGEGDCMIDGKSYMNSHIIPTTNKCQTSCRCINSVVTCEHVKCSPPPSNMKNCQAVYHTKEACCPMYTCEHEEPNAIESGNQMSQDFDHKDESHSTEVPHEIVEEPIVPSVHKPDCNEESGCEIQTKKPSSVIDEEDTEKQHGLVDTGVTSPATDKLESSDSTEKHDDEQDILVSTRQQPIETVTPSIVKEVTASPNIEDSQVDSEKEVHIQPSTTKYDDTTVYDKHDDNSVDQIHDITKAPEKVPSDKEDITLRPVFDDQKPEEIDRATTVFSDAESTKVVTMKTKAETTTVSSDDVNKIGVSVLPTDSVDDITPPTPVKECKDQGCKVEAHYTRYPIIGSESTTPREVDVQKCGPYGCEDEEQNIIGSDDTKKPLCGPNGCLTDTKPSSSGEEMLSPDLLSSTQKPEITGIPLDIDSETSTLHETQPTDDKVDEEIKPTTSPPSKIDNEDEKCEGDSCSVESVSTSTEKTIESQTQSEISVQEYETTVQKEYATTKSPTVLEKDSTPISEVDVTEKESIDSEEEKGVTGSVEGVTHSDDDHSISPEDGEKKITTESSQSHDESSSPQTISSLETDSGEKVEDSITEKTDLQTEKPVEDGLKDVQTEHSIYPTSVKPFDEPKTQSTDESSATHPDTEKPIIQEDHTREIVPTTVSMLDETTPSDEKVDESHDGLEKEQVPSDKTEKPLTHVDSDNEIEQKPVDHTISEKPIESETNDLSSDLDKSTELSLDEKLTTPGDFKPHDADESQTEKSHFTETTSEKEPIDDGKTTPPPKTIDEKQPEEIDQSIVDLPEIVPESTDSPKVESDHVSPSLPSVTVQTVQDQSTSDDFEKHTDPIEVSKDISTERVHIIADGEIESEKTTSQVKDIDTTEKYERHTTEKEAYKPTEPSAEHSTSEPVQSTVTESGTPKLGTTTTLTHDTTVHPQTEYDSSKTEVPLDDTKKDTMTTIDVIKDEEESYSTAAPHIPLQTDEKPRPSVKDELSPTTVISEETTHLADEVEVHTESIQESYDKKPESDDHKMDSTEKPVVVQTTANILEQATLKQDFGDVDTEKDKEQEKPIVEDDLDQKLESHTEKPIHKPSEIEVPHKPEDETIKEESTTHHTDTLPSHDVTPQLHDDISPETHTEREEVITTRKQFDITIASEETTVGHTDFETTPSQDTKDVYSKTTEKPHIESTEKSHDETTLHIDIDQTDKEQSTIQSLDHTTVQPKQQPPHPETTDKAQFDEATTQLDTLLPHEGSDEDAVSSHHDIGTSPSSVLEDADNLQTTVQTLGTESQKEPVQHDLEAETTAHPQVETTVIQHEQDEITHADEEVSEHPKKPEIEIPATGHVETTIKPYEGAMETSQPHSETTAQPQQETTAQPQDESSTKQHAETTIQPEAKTTVQPHTVLDVETEKDSKPIQTETTVSVQEADSTEQPHLSTTLSDQGEFVESHKDDQPHVVPEIHDRIPEEDKPDADGHPQDETPIEPHIPTTLQSLLDESTHQPQPETTVHSLAETTVDTKAKPTIVSQDETVPEHVESTSKATVQSTTDYIIDYITSKIPFMEKSTTRPETTSKHTTTEVEEEVSPPIDEEDINQEPQMPDPSSSYGTSGQESDYEEEETFGPGTCRYGGKIYVSAQQIPRDDPCDFCFCFRSDIICLQQSCPPPINHCHEEPIPGFCCPRYECPVSMATVLNVTTTTTTTTTTLPPHFLSHAYKGQAQRKGCQIDGHVYRVGEVIKQTSGPCLHCICGADGQMKCDPKKCTPEPMLRQMIAVAATQRRRR